VALFSNAYGPDGSPMRILMLLALLLAACGPATDQPKGSAPSATPAAASPVEQLQRADFAFYPVAPYTGPKQAPDFSGPHRALRVYRSLLSDAVNTGPNFAGRYALTQIGCGASCTTAYLIDVSTGGIQPLLFGGELSPYALDLGFQRDSTLLRAHWQIIDRQANPLRCEYENFVLRERRLVSLGRADAGGECPLPQ
jgi:hypothetical protein